MQTIKQFLPPHVPPGPFIHSRVPIIGSAKHMPVSRIQIIFQDHSDIGLTLVKRTVLVGRSRVWVESEGIGKGSTFCFTLSTEGKT